MTPVTTTAGSRGLLAMAPWGMRRGQPPWHGLTLAAGPRTGVRSGDSDLRWLRFLSLGACRWSRTNMMPTQEGVGGHLCMARGIRDPLGKRLAAGPPQGGGVAQWAHVATVPMACARGGRSDPPPLPAGWSPGSSTSSGESSGAWGGFPSVGSWLPRSALICSGEHEGGVTSCPAAPSPGGHLVAQAPCPAQNPSPHHNRWLASGPAAPPGSRPRPPGPSNPT